MQLADTQLTDTQLTDTQLTSGRTFPFTSRCPLTCEE
jgi:hypothetical protein